MKRPLGIAVVAACPFPMGNHGRNGWLIDGDRPEDLARSILDLIADDDLARRLGANARDRASAHFAWPAAAVRLETAFEASLR